MHEKLMKMMAKKRDLSPSEKKAKMDAVHEMRGAASEMMGHKMDGLKKVSVMSNSKEGLAAGLDKAKGIVSQDQEDQMSSDAEAPYSDAKHAMQEHDGEQQSDEMGNMPGMADGGPVVQPDPQKTQDAQDSMRQAFHFNEGGEVESPDMDQSDEGYSAREESDDAEDGSPADADASDEGESDEDEMSEEELDSKLAKLMKMKQKMESRKS
jgi:hypothetical protein